MTGKDEWHDEHGPKIELEEWQGVVEADPSMEMRSEAVANLGDGKQLIAHNETVAVWLDHDGEVHMWLHLFEGNVVGKNPQPDAIDKMHALSVVFDAKLIGDEGEHYDADGTATYPEFKVLETQKAGAMPRPWWKFW